MAFIRIRWQCRMPALCPNEEKAAHASPQYPGRRQGRKVSKDTHAASLQTEEPVLQRAHALWELRTPWHHVCRSSVWGEWPGLAFCGHLPHAELLQMPSMARPFAPGHGLASTAVAANGSARCLFLSLPCFSFLEGMLACLEMHFKSWRLPASQKATKRGISPHILISFSILKIITPGASGLACSPFKHLSVQLIPALF